MLDEAPVVTPIKYIVGTLAASIVCNEPIGYREVNDPVAPAART